MTDVLAILLRGEITLAQADDAWLLACLEREHPDVVPVLRVEDPYRDGGTWHNFAWYALEPALTKAGVTGDALRDWEVASRIVEALTHPQERLDEAVQFTRAAILGLRAWASEHHGSQQAGVADAIARAIAFAFATQDHDGEDDLRNAAVAWFETFLNEPA